MSVNYRDSVCYIPAQIRSIFQSVVHIPAHVIFLSFLNRMLV